MSLKPPVGPNTPLGTGRVYFNVQSDFGARGDGVTDDTAAITAAITAARAANGVCYAPQGDYLITSSLTASANVTDVHFKGAGKGRTRLIHQIPGAAMFRTVGDIAAGVALTGVAALGAQSLTVASTTGLAVGDMLLLRDLTQTISDHDAPTVQAVAGEVVRVKSVDSATAITLYGKTDFSYTTSATYRKLTQATGWVLEDFTIENPTAGSGGASALGINLRRADRPRIRNVEFIGLDDDGIKLAYCTDFRVSDCDFFDLRSELANTPYGVHIAEACQGGVIDGLIGRRLRHLVTSGLDASEPEPAHVVVSNCVGEECYGSVFDTHQGGRWWLFDGCIARASDNAAAEFAGYGFQIRGRYITLRDPQAHGCKYGIYLVIGDHIKVRGGLVADCDIGLDINSAPYSDVRGLTASDCVTNGVRVEKTGTETPMQGIVLEDIEVFGDPSGAAFKFDYWHSSFRIGRIRAPDATTKSSGRIASDWDTYEVIADRGGQLSGALGSTTNLQPDGAVVNSNAGAGRAIFYFNPDDQMNADTVVLEVKASCATNDTAVGATLAVGLYPVATVAGAASNTVTITRGAVVSGSEVTFTTPAANQMLQGSSGLFTAPAAGFYCLAVTVAGTTAANAGASIRGTVRMRRAVTT